MPDTTSSNVPGRSPVNGETRYRQIFERANDAIFLIDIERDKMLDVNDRACRMLEYSREELLALPFSATHPDDVAWMRECVQGVLDQGSDWTNELTCVTKCGHRVPAEISASVVDLEGRTCLLGLVRPRRRYEQFQKLFEWIFESTPHATLAIDARGRITLVNSQLERLFGYDRAEILGQTVEILIPERFRDAHVAHRDDFDKDPRTRPMGAGLEPYGRRKDGSEFAVDIELSPVTGTGLVLSLVRDVSERKREHERLQQRATGLQQLVEERSARLRRSEGRQDVLLDVNNAIIGSLDRESLFDAIARALRNVIGFDRASVTLADMSRGVSTVHALVGELVDGTLLSGLPVGSEIPHKGTRIGRVLEECRPLVVRNLSRELVVGIQHALVDEGLRSAIIAPLMSRRGAIGTINVYSLTPDRYSDDDGEFLTAVGSQLAVAIENMLGYEEIARLKASLEQENIYLQEEIKTEHPYEGIVGHSVALRKIAQAVEIVAATDATVLITGETGTGKELIARAVHNLSPRRAKAMVKVNCAALPSGLVENDLFGHEKGAFTDAIARKIGRFEVAHGSTIFLDEVGDLPMDLQAKLLRVLQEGEFERVGGTHTIKVNTRVIAATNQDLDQAMRDGRFRPDLYYRLSVFPITLPPLRDRREDIPPLVRHVVMKSCKKLAKRIESIPNSAMDALCAYSWPGNVRELENVIDRAVIVSRGPQLELGEWAAPAREVPRKTGFSTLEEVERRHIRDVLESTGWVVSGEKGAAKLLGLKPTTLEARMKRLGITRTG